jgi:hypothetical protein
LTSDRRYPELADQIGVFSHGKVIILKWLGLYMKLIIYMM